MSTKEGLHIVNFNLKKLIKEDSRGAEFYSSLANCPPLPDLNCCVNSCVEEAFQDYIGIDNEFIDSGSFSQDDLDKIEETCSEMFVETEEQEQVNLKVDIDLNDVFKSMTSENMGQEQN